MRSLFRFSRQENFFLRYLKFSLYLKNNREINCLQFFSKVADIFIKKTTIDYKSFTVFDIHKIIHRQHESIFLINHNKDLALVYFLRY